MPPHIKNQQQEDAPTPLSVEKKGHPNSEDMWTFKGGEEKGRAREGVGTSSRYEGMMVWML